MKVWPVMSPAQEHCGCDNDPEVEEYYAETPASEMTLRDYFAGCALMGMTAHPKIGSAKHATDDQLAEWAYDAADSMMAERGKR